MILKKIFLSIFGIVFLLHFKTVSAQTSLCSIKVAQDILTCALNRHPEVLQAQGLAERDKALKKIAGQSQNLELESKIVGGENDGAAVLNTETSVLHTLELGGKKKARLDQAEAQNNVTFAELLKSKEQVALNTILSLYRLRQIKTELLLIQESLTAFGHILEQYKSRPKLTPEQDVSLSVFGMAQDELNLQKTTLLQEQSELQSFLEVATGLPYSSLQNHLPKSKSQWPKLSSNEKESTLLASGDLKKAEADLSLAQTNLNLAKSNAWPNLKLGPTFETDTQSNDTIFKGGITFSLPLPLFHQNQGEKDYAALDLVRARTQYESIQQKTALERAKQFKRYQSALQVLGHIRSIPALMQKHHDIESFIDRGLVPSSLVIESHRQIYEISTSRFKQELAALDALWRIFIIEGRVFQEKI